MPTLLDGIDTSYHELTREQAQALRDAGITVYWQCLWTGVDTPPPAISNLRIADEFGFILLGYVSVTRFGSGSWHVANARQAVPDDLWAKLVMVPVDVELTGISDQIIRDALERLVQLGKPRRSIYSSCGHWTSEQGNSTAFTDCLVFNANWDNDKDFDFPRCPWGGFTPEQVVCEQYTGGGLVEGVFADRDVFVKELLIPEDDDMGKYTEQKLDAAFGAILTTLAKSLDIGNAAAAAIIDHVNTHPGGGASTTMAAALAELQVKQAEVQADYDRFKAAIAAAAAEPVK